jgi:hypothetical protein
LNQLPWDLAKDEFGGKGADFIALACTLLTRTAKDQSASYAIDPKGVLSNDPPRRKRPDPSPRILKPVAQTLEFHQLDCRLEHLRVRRPARFRQLLASLAETGQQTPIIVIPSEQRYLVIDGHQRIAALKQLRGDTVSALVWEISEAEALLLAHSLRMNSEPETALEQGWLLAEMEEKLGYD